MTESQAEIPEYISVVCPTCQARLTPRSNMAGKTIKCPDCYVIVQVPTVAEWLKRRQPKSRKPAEDLEPYQLQAVEEPKYVEPSFLNRQAEIRAEPAPVLPRWTFFSNVFTFPWNKEVWGRWVYLSMGCSAVGVVASLGAWVAAGTRGYATVGVAFFALPLIWLLVWTSSYAAACCLAILQDTAAGNDQVAGWPEPDWREWAARLIFVGYVAILTGVVACGIAVLTEVLGGTFWWGFGISFYMLYPILLLSVLETNSLFQPISLPVVKSLFCVAWAWLAYYALAATTIATWAIPAFWAIKWLPIVGTFVTGPLLAAALFITARLLGRLAWKVVQILG